MKKILLIYTGGTIGMTKDYETKALVPFDFNNISEKIPEFNLIDADLDIISFGKPIDSSDMGKKGWQKIADIIHQQYNNYHGFVVLHGTDTMAYAASAISFMLQGLTKPVIFTGSQLPIGDLRTDAKENLISSIHFAALADERAVPIIQEVCIYFEYKLYRGNRTIKMSSNHFDAFESPNYSFLAESGVQMMVNHNVLYKKDTSELKYYPELCDNVALLKIHPTMNDDFLLQVLDTKDLKVLIIETFGSGNIFTNKKFNEKLKLNVKNGLNIVVATQCVYGAVAIGKYESSSIWLKLKAVSAKDMTTEAALLKAMHVQGNLDLYSDFKHGFEQNLAGEITIEQNNFS